MVSFEQRFCRSVPWGWFAREVVVPWALQGEELRGDVLEIGAGSGAAAAQLLQRFPDIQLTAADYDQSMVDAAQQRLVCFGERGHALRQDARNLTFPDGSFDAVVSFIMLHHVINWEQALTEAARVLRPGGLLLGYDLLASAPWRAFHQLEGSSDRTRLMRFAELRDYLRRGPLVGSIQPSLCGLTVRFVLHRPERPQGRPE